MRFSAFILAASLALAACNSSSNGTPPPPVPGLSIATQRIEAQSSIAIANGIEAASLIAILLKSLGPSGAIAEATPKCRNGVETTTTVIGPQRVKVVIDVFYDPQCTTLLTHAVLHVGFTDARHMSVLIDGKATTYSSSGKPVAFATIAANGTLGATTQFTTTGGIALTRTGPAILTFGLSCTLASSNSCGFGGIATVSSTQSLGVSSSLHGFVASGTGSGTVALNAYTGAPGSLSLVHAKDDTWKISGGSLAATQNGSFHESVKSASLNVSGSLNLSDSLANASTSANFGTRTGIGNGVVSQTSTGKSFATYSTDAAGSGEIHYSDGSTGDIVFFIITS